MSDLSHHSTQQYGCPPVVYLLLITGGHRGALLPFAWDTDRDALIDRAGPVGGVVVQLPVVHCNLPSLENWLT